MSCGSGKVIGSLPVDLSGNLQLGGIPCNAQGLMVSWNPDGNGNASGNVTILVNQNRAIPWGYLAAGQILCGPIPNSDEGTQIELILGPGAPQGVLLFEFTEQPIPRARYS